MAITAAVAIILFFKNIAGMAAAGLIGIVTKDRKKEQENHDNG